MKTTLRDAGFIIGDLPTGTKNSITDVSGIKVGHFTINKEMPNNEKVVSGVTAIIPHAGNLFYEKVPAAYFILNGFGKTTGLVQVDEMGVIESPIMLTNTFSVPSITEGTISYMLENNPNIGEIDGTVNVVVGECNDSYLNNIRELYLRPNHAIDAIINASTEKVEQGSIGAGTGMTCFGWKGGIGSSSRLINSHGSQYTIGALVLSNFGLPDELTILGEKIGKVIKPIQKNKPDDGSIIIVIGTDAPLDSRQLKRLAKRASLGLARTGSIAHNGSGDIIIAFSNGNKVLHNKDNDELSMRVVNDNSPTMTKLFQAVVESVEESILNSLFTAETTFGRLDRIREQIPVETVIDLLKQNYDKRGV